MPYELLENAACQLFCRISAWMLSSSCLRRADPGQKFLRRGTEGCLSIAAKECWGRASLAQVVDFTSFQPEVVLGLSRPVVFISLTVVKRGPHEWFCQQRVGIMESHNARELAGQDWRMEALDVEFAGRTT